MLETTTDKLPHTQISLGHRSVHTNTMAKWPAMSQWVLRLSDKHCNISKMSFSY